MAAVTMERVRSYVIPNNLTLAAAANTAAAVPAVEPRSDIAGDYDNDPSDQSLAPYMPPARRSSSSTNCIINFGK